MINTDPIEILLVEDNPADARLILEVFNRFKTKNRFIVVEDGEEAMNYLYQKGEYKDSKCPSLILLDLNLPKKDGREVLKEIKNDEKLKIIPVIILTTSNQEEDIYESYTNHANAYLTKPSDFNEFIELVESFESFWLNMVTLPHC